MLFGAYNLVVTQRGLECDGWLPVTGNLYGLDDVQRLKGLLERCMLRVFEGVGKSLTRGRDERWKGASTKVVETRSGGQSSRIRGTASGDNGGGGKAGDAAEADEADAEAEEVDGMEEGEKESDDEEEEGLNGGGGTTKRIVEPLSIEEIRELDLLTTDVVRILDMYAMERETGSIMGSRAQSPGGGGGGGSGARTPQSQGQGQAYYGGGYSGSGFGLASSAGASGPGGGGGGGQGVYQPPGKRW